MGFSSRISQYPHILPKFGYTNGSSLPSIFKLGDVMLKIHNDHILTSLALPQNKVNKKIGIPASGYIIGPTCNESYHLLCLQIALKPRFNLCIGQY